MIEQAKALLVTYQTSMPQATTMAEKQAEQDRIASETAAVEKQKAAELRAAASAQAAADAQAAALIPAEDPDEDPEIKELRLMVAQQMGKK